MQTWAAVEHGYWYARSPEFLQNGTIAMFRWLRVVGDTIFSAGVVALVLFTIGLATGQSLRRKTAAALPAVPAPTRV
jgi:nitric oxide reductase subunit B